VDPGATASDSLDGNLTSSITITGTVDVNTTGVYTLTYSISDGASNEANATRTVNVGQASTHNAELNATVQLQMLWVEPGTFTMGSPTTETGRGTNETEHNVTLTKGFYLGKYEVTQAQYEAVMTGNTDSLSATPSQYPNNPNRPVEKVSWADAQIFLTRLNAQQSASIPAGWAYVLPTESQWEYACRAGTSTTYSWGNDINSTRANYNWDGGANDGNDFKQTRDVGQYAANPWGFFDMNGNVWEWTADWYQAAYPTGNPVVDPTGPASGSHRVIRGGSWDYGGTHLRSARRNYSSPSNRSATLGFRVGFQQQ
jgi:formylglycine-generating enzyme required for sulfatase activity